MNLQNIFFTALTLCFSLLTKGQNKPSNYHSRYQKLAIRDSHETDSSYNLEKDTLNYHSSLGSIIQSVLIFNPDLSKTLSFDSDKCTYLFEKNINIDSSVFINDENFPLPKSCNGNDALVRLYEGFSILHCSFSDDLSVNNVAYSTQAGAVDVNYNKCKNFELTNNQFRLFNVMKNEISNNLSISWTQSDVTIIANNSLKDTSKNFEVSYSNFKTALELIDNYCGKIAINNDTISGLLSFIYNTTDNGYKQKTKKEITVTDSHINAKCFVDINDSLFESKLVFENCSFGSSASLFNLKVDTIVFKNCTNIPYPLFVSADTSKKTIFIQLINSNVNNIRFDYTDRFAIFFDYGVTEETKNNTYQSLLAKYKAEGKPKNIEKIDIEYKRYEYKNSWWMYPIWLLDYGWWRYGYSKWLIIVWTLLLIGVFFGYNYKNWEGMRKMYSVFDKDDLSILGHGDNNVRTRKKIIYVLLFTSFIFFSLRVDFDKLKYANNRYLVSFFTQYIIGLICLFFLANAIFKLG